MEKIDGWWFPDNEKHLPQWIANPKVRMFLNGRAAYQGAKQVAAMDLCTNFRTAVDCGSHIGLWSWNLAHRFDSVHAFEPVAAHRECFNKNLGLDHRSKTENATAEQLGKMVPGVTVDLHACALGDHEGSVSIRTEPTSSGDSRIDGDGDIPLKTLDSFHLEDVDLLKIDVEGTELFVLRGAEELLAKQRPVIVVEQKPGHAQKYGLGEQDAIPYLESLGYRLVKEMAGDFFFVPNERHG